MQVIQNTDMCAHNEDKQLILQQSLLINVLKDEIVRLQVQLTKYERENTFLKQQIENKDIQFYHLNQKVKSISENNQSILQTFQVFQREFVKRDYQSVLDLMQFNSIAQQGSFSTSLLTSVKTRSNRNITTRPKKKSSVKDFYGYFLESNTGEQQAQLSQELDKSISKLNKVKSYGKKNFFNQHFRDKFWFKAIPNKLAITEKLYQKIAQKLTDFSVNSILRQDLRRMDVKLPDSQAKQVLEQVEKCISAFEIYRPDIGYVQGMNYFAWMLVIRMDNYECFRCFSNIILCDPFISSLFNFEQKRIKRIIQYYEQCLTDKRPKLAKHMKNLSVDSDLFIIEWAYTFFTRAFNLRIVSKIWDLWFSEGYNVFYKVCMVIMELLEPLILQQFENDKIIEIVRTSTLKLNQQQFLRMLLKTKIFDNLILQ